MFVTHGPVDPESPLFTGREAELQRMESWLAQVNCVGALLGARQTGKTSLLLQLRRRVQAKYGVAFVNLESIVGATAEECFAFVASELLDQLSEAVPRQHGTLPDAGRTFLAFLRALSRNLRAIRVAVLIDEIGALPEETIFRLAHSLRAVFTERYNKPEYGKFVFILSGATEMLALAEGKNSPLKNVMESIYLEDFTEDETRLLLSRGTALAGVELAPALCTHVHRWIGGHPYLTQLTAARLLQAPSPFTEETVELVVERLLYEEDKNLPHVRRALDHSRPAAWDKVAALAAGTPLPFSRSNALDAELELIGVVKNENGLSKIRNALYNRAVQLWLHDREDQRIGRVDGFRRRLIERLSLDDLRDLCFDLGIDFESLGGESKPAVVRELILHLERRGGLSELERWLRLNRPDLA